MLKHVSPSLDSILSKTIDLLPGTYSIAIKDLSLGRQWIVNPTPMRSASLIKIFIMVEAFRQVNQGTLDLTDKQMINASDQVGGAGSLEFVPSGTKKNWRELIELMIVESDNTATNLLIKQLTMDKINTTITALGCANTVLRRYMMDFLSAEQGRENITTVNDIALVLEKIYHNSCLDVKSDTIMLEILTHQEDKCKLPVLLPPSTRIAHKTGELEGAEHDAGIIYGPNCHYIIAVMTDFLPDALQGQQAISQISHIVFQYLNHNA